MATQKHSKEKIVKYIEATMISGMDKKAAYKKFINNTISHPAQAVARLEKTAEYNSVYELMHGDDSIRMERAVKEVKRKYVGLVDKTIETMDGILNEVKDHDINEKAKAVRLASETLTALNFVDSPQPSAQQGNIDTGAMVL